MKLLCLLLLSVGVLLHQGFEGQVSAMDPASPQATVVIFDQAANRLTIEGDAIIKVIGNQVEIRTPEKEEQKENKCIIL